MFALQASRDAEGAAEQLEEAQRLTRQLVHRLPHMLIQTASDCCVFLQASRDTTGAAEQLEEAQID